MVDSSDIIGILAVLVGVGLLATAALSIEIPGTGLGGDESEKRCDLQVQYSVEGTTADARINEGTFRSSTEESGLFSFSIGQRRTYSEVLSIPGTGASNVEATTTLVGNVEGGSIQTKTTVGRLGALEAETVRSGFSRLTQGSYEVQVDVVWGDGSDQLTKDLEVTC